MQRSRIVKAIVFASALPLLYLAGATGDSPQRLTLFARAHAIVGAPATPLSVAGVARRTTVRTVAATSASASTSQQQTATAQQQEATAKQQEATAKQQEATAKQQAAAARPAGAPAVGAVVNKLPAGCKPEIKSGVEYQNCGGVLYRSAFQGNTLVYVVQ
jgi:hypothetical protein